MKDKPCFVWTKGMTGVPSPAFWYNWTLHINKSDQKIEEERVLARHPITQDEFDRADFAEMMAKYPPP